MATAPSRHTSWPASRGRRRADRRARRRRWSGRTALPGGLFRREPARATTIRDHRRAGKPARPARRSPLSSGRRDRDRAARGGLAFRDLKRPLPTCTPVLSCGWTSWCRWSVVRVAAAGTRSRVATNEPAEVHARQNARDRRNGSTDEFQLREIVGLPAPGCVDKAARRVILSLADAPSLQTAAASFQNASHTPPQLGPPYARTSRSTARSRLDRGRDLRSYVALDLTGRLNRANGYAGWCGALRIRGDGPSVSGACISSHARVSLPVTLQYDVTFVLLSVLVGGARLRAGALHCQSGGSCFLVIVGASLLMGAAINGNELHRHGGDATGGGGVASGSRHRVHRHRGDGIVGRAAAGVPAARRGPRGLSVGGGCAPATVMGMAISGMHYTGMAAAASAYSRSRRPTWLTFAPRPGGRRDHQYRPDPDSRPGRGAFDERTRLLTRSSGPATTPKSRAGSRTSSSRRSPRVAHAAETSSSADADAALDR